METKKVTIKDLYDYVLYEHEEAGNTLQKTLEKAVKAGANLEGANLYGADLAGAILIGANLRGAKLEEANLRVANLSEADLSGANLRCANLRCAKLTAANLEHADLRGANLSSAKTDNRYISVSRIGSRKGTTTYCFEEDIIWCGCYTGTLSEFENRVKEEHKDNPQHLKEYLGFIEYIKSLK
jgi:hypothetical protein